MRGQGNGEDLSPERRILLFGDQRTTTERPRWSIHADLHGLQEQGRLRQHAEPELPGEKSSPLSRAHNQFRTKILLTPNAAQRTTTASLCVDSAVLLTTAQKNQAGGTLPTEASGLTKEKNLDTKSEFDLFFSLTANYAAHSITATNLVKSE